MHMLHLIQAPGMPDARVATIRHKPEMEGHSAIEANLPNIVILAKANSKSVSFVFQIEGSEKTKSQR